MSEQNRNYIKKEIGKLLSEIWQIKGLSEQENPKTLKSILKQAGLKEIKDGKIYDNYREG